MKKNVSITSLLVIFFMITIFTGCKKDNTSEFNDELKLGTGMIGFDLTGEASTFTLTDASIFLYFRLESKDDMAGRNIILDFLTSGDNLINTITREPAQNYGHITLSSFEWEGGTGNFKINAYLDNGADKLFIATTDFTIN
jgi:hypothetical protein